MPENGSGKKRHSKFSVFIMEYWLSVLKFNTPPAI